MLKCWNCLQVVRSLFYNKANSSIITVSVYKQDNFSSLNCRSTSLECDAAPHRAEWRVYQARRSVHHGGQGSRHREGSASKARGYFDSTPYTLKGFDSLNFRRYLGCYGIRNPQATGPRRMFARLDVVTRRAATAAAAGTFGGGIRGPVSLSSRRSRCDTRV